MRSLVRPRLLVRPAMIFALAMISILAPVGAAFAHAQLLATDPAENAVLAAAPDHLELTFNEPVSPLVMRLVGPDGALRELAGGAAGSRVAIPISALGAGTHVLSWRVVSSDGHPIGGALVFSVDRATGAAEIAAGEAAVTIALWAAKALLFICLFVGIGGAVFAVLSPLPPAARRLATILCSAGVLMAAATLGLQGLDALGLPLSSIVSGTAWSGGMATSYGLTAIAAAVAFLVALGALGLSRSRASSALGLTAGALAALSLALSGHASAAEPQWLTRPSVFLHLGGILFWVGALWPLRLLLGTRSEAADRALAAFSAGIPYAVAPLLVSGATLAAIQMGWPGPQWVTPYAFILAAKLGLLVVLFALAVWNRGWLTRPALAGDADARTRLRRSIGLEMVLVVVIVGLVAGWRFTPPPRALTAVPVAVAAEPLMLHLFDASTMAMVTIAPGAVGPVTLDIALSDLEGTPKQVQSVAVMASAPALGIEPIRRDATPTEGGWRVEDLTIPVAGEWLVALEVRVSRFELVRLEDTTAIP